MSTFFAGDGGRPPASHPRRCYSSQHLNIFSRFKFSIKDRSEKIWICYILLPKPFT